MDTVSIRRLFAVVVLAVAGVAAAPFSTAPPAAAAVTVVYVVPGGAGTKDGSSWANAADLSPAIKNSQAGQELWVRAGTYIPDDLEAGIRATFKLKSGVAIYGGFNGTETSRDQRDFGANVTILSGDFTRNGIPTDNLAHVVTATGTDSTAILDGFTITGGYAVYRDLGAEYSTGAGVYLYGGSPSFSNLIITNNHAFEGGGMWAINGGPSLTDVTISNNVADLDGGGLWVAGGPLNVSLNRVTVSGNHAGGNGGGIRAGSIMTIDNSIITDNTADAEGGPLEEGGGGGLYNSGKAVVRNTDFVANSADGYGGGIYSRDQFGLQPMELTNSYVTGNVSTGEGFWQGHGGGIYFNFGSPVLKNVVISGNHADRAGAFHSSGKPSLINVTIAGNTAPSTGGLVSIGQAPIIRNSILWGNGQSLDDNINGFDILNSIVQGGYAGAGNLDVDPMFVTPVPAAPSTGGDVRLQASSPAINAGSNAHLPAGLTVDLDDLPRTVGGIVDMGAFERQTVQTLTFAPLGDKAVGDPPFKVTATASSGLPVTFGAAGVCTVNVDEVTLTGPGTCTITASQAGDATHDPVSVSRSFQVTSDACTVEGTADPDVLNGTPGSDVICGYGGDDTINGMGGDDRLVGGSGKDTIDGGTGADKVFGRKGDDQLHGGDGNDLLRGGPGSDDHFGEAGDDIVHDRDGAGNIDDVQCGTGTDVARVDVIDTVNADCDRRVNRP